MYFNSLLYVSSTSSNFPGLLIGAQMCWLCDWPQEALLGEATYFIAKHHLTEDFEDLRQVVIHETVAMLRVYS